MLSRYV
jgi:integrase/recombinase XerD